MQAGFIATMKERLRSAYDDYVDPMPIFEKMFKKRLKAYKALGYKETFYPGYL